MRIVGDSEIAGIDGVARSNKFRFTALLKAIFIATLVTHYCGCSDADRSHISESPWILKTKDSQRTKVVSSHTNGGPDPAYFVTDGEYRNLKYEGETIYFTPPSDPDHKYVPPDANGRYHLEWDITFRVEEKSFYVPTNPPSDRRALSVIVEEVHGVEWYPNDSD